MIPVHRPSLAGFVSSVAPGALLVATVPLALACQERAVPTRPSEPTPVERVEQTSSKALVRPEQRTLGEPEPADASETDTGYRRFSLGPTAMTLRARELSCPTLKPTSAIDPSRIEPSSECRAHSECQEKPFGACVVHGPIDGCAPAPRSRYVCRYGCAEDSDCGKAEVCLCGVGQGTCVANLCPENGCGATEVCSTCNSYPRREFRCHTEESAARDCNGPIY